VCGSIVQSIAETRDRLPPLPNEWLIRQHLPPAEDIAGDDHQTQEAYFSRVVADICLTVEINFMVARVCVRSRR
jgi:hypothetical protein